MSGSRRLTAGAQRDGAATSMGAARSVRCLGRRALLVLTMVVSVLVGAPPVAMAVVSPAGVATPVVSGAYVGGINVAQLAAFGAWRGRPVEMTNDFLPADSWSAIEGPSWFLDTWSKVAAPMVLGVPLLPSDGSTLAAGATGAYDAHFRTLATRLVASGQADATLRLGWEFNGNWFGWSSVGHEVAFIAYWRHVVDAMRSVPGQQFDVEWNPTLGSGQPGYAVEKAWPGDTYVDSIGLDVYDSIWGDSTATPAQRWSAVQDGRYGLDWWADWALTHSKRLGFPEWGLVDKAAQNGGGGGDNPLFITSFFDWIRVHDVRYETYFDVDVPDGKHLLDSGQFPNAARVYQAVSSANAPRQ